MMEAMKTKYTEYLTSAVIILFLVKQNTDK